MKTKMLTQELATTIYRAMCELNNVNAKIDVLIGTPDNGLHIWQYKWCDNGKVYIHLMNHGVVLDDECYADQDDFREVYGIK